MRRAGRVLRSALGRHGAIQYIRISRFSMRSFSTVTLSGQEFDDFSATHAQGNFQQTSCAGTLRAGQGVDVEYLGVKENGAVVAAALLETHRASRLSTFAVVHDGEGGQARRAVGLKQRGGDHGAVLLDAQVLHVHALAGAQCPGAGGLLEVALRMGGRKVVEFLATEGDGAE